MIDFILDVAHPLRLNKLHQFADGYWEAQFYHPDGEVFLEGAGESAETALKQALDHARRGFSYDLKRQAAIKADANEAQQIKALFTPKFTITRRL